MNSTLNSCEISNAKMQPYEHEDIHQDKKSEERPSIVQATLESLNFLEDERPAPKILPIKSKDIHRICSGQVIVTLSTAVKELVENSIDAGATNIDIRLVEYGSKVIEVSDNGMGVEDSNLAGLTLKHHTSKISEFQDLTTIETFGFRGEALSSLCSLAKLTVITKSKLENAAACKVEYDSQGKIVRKLCYAREKGTTVILEDLFAPLPVRHREFIKNLKQQFNKMINVLYGYCLINNGVRLNCTNQTGTGTSSKILCIPAVPTMKERIVSLFGSKQLNTLLEIKQCDDISADILSEYGLSEELHDSNQYVLEGYISAPHKGRSSNDRQFFWINNRPCEPSKISRLVNEIYHGYSRNQSPFVCLNIKTKQEEVDVNVTPDKRVIYLQNEKRLCVTIKATLVALYSSASSGFSSSDQLINSYYPATFSGNMTAKSKCNSPEITFAINDSDQEKFAPMRSSPLFSPEESKIGKLSPKMTNEKLKNLLKGFARGNSGNTDSSTSTFLRQPYKRKNDSSNICTTNRNGLFTDNKQHSWASDSLTTTLSQDRDEDTEIHPSNCIQKQTICQENEEDSSQTGQTSFADEDAGMTTCDDYDSPFFLDSSLKENEPGCLFTEERDRQELETKTGKSYSNEHSPLTMYDNDFEDNMNENQSQVSASVNWDDIKNKLTSKSKCNDTEMSYYRKFRAKIAPGDNESAEEELKKQITKNMFSQMEIIGQFNLGFIIVKFGPDMFIVDQHASDEKYNFETLEKNTVLKGQKLISPMDLQLPAVSENIIMNNLEIFQKNGFEFEINADGDPTNRIKMTKIPYSKSVEFGKSDVEELIFMMGDCPEKSFCRPSRVREMFASRACRKSVMIGTAMSHQDMRTLVDNMGLINQPWNCPHGRPTIRHLMNLNLLPDMDLTAFNH